MPPGRLVDSPSAAGCARLRLLMSDPLKAWVQPLTRQEREAEVRRGLADGLVVSFTTRVSGWQHWCPVLPRDVPQCPICTLPTRGSALCAGCKKLTRLYGRPVDTLEFLAITNKREAPESLMWSWKDETTKVDGTWEGQHDWLGGVTAALGGYLQAHAERLLDGGAVQTAVPSLARRPPLIAALSKFAASDAQRSLDLTRTGSKVGDWLQHEWLGRSNDSSERPTTGESTKRRSRAGPSFSSMMCSYPGRRCSRTLKRFDRRERRRSGRSRSVGISQTTMSTRLSRSS